MRAFLLSLLAILPLSSAIAGQPAEGQAEIRAVLNAQAEAWNEGDLEGFMAHYEKSDELRFASGNRVRRGWQTVMDRYRRTYGNLTDAGRLSFDDLEIDLIGDDGAVVFGRFHLDRDEGEDPTGIFTLVFRLKEDGWVIVHDHTSS